MPDGHINSPSSRWLAVSDCQEWEYADLRHSRGFCSRAYLNQAMCHFSNVAFEMMTECHIENSVAGICEVDSPESLFDSSIRLAASHLPCSSFISLMVLKLTLKDHLPVLTDFSSFPWEGWSELSVAELGRVKVRVGRTKVPVSDLFEVESDDSTEESCLHFEADFSKAIHVGRGWSAGTLRVVGHAGQQFAQEVTGGKIVVRGDVGTHAATGMKGGELHIHGDAGDFFCSHATGARFGLNGGEVLVWGDVGAYAGTRMRRGLLAVAGDAGEMLGHQIRAGTIFVGGHVGDYVGYGMRRGSIVLSDHNAGFDPGPRFVEGGLGEFQFLRLYSRALRAHGFPVSSDFDDSLMKRFTGDITELNRGEVLIPTS